MKVYKTQNWSTKIEEIEVDKMTEKSFWVKHNRYDKNSAFSNYWDTLKEAKQYLQKHFGEKLLYYQKKTAHIESKLKELDKY